LLEDPLADSAALPCSECPLALLNRYLESPRGRLLLVVAELESALEARIQVPLNQVSYLEFRLLRLLREERGRFEREEIERSSKRGR
jgi:hypothetical protein